MTEQPKIGIVSQSIANSDDSITLEEPLSLSKKIEIMADETKKAKNPVKEYSCKQ